MDAGATTSWEMTLPDAGATRDMLGLLRQLFGDKERASFASMVAILQSHADSASPGGRRLLDVVAGFETARQGVFDSWDAASGGRHIAPAAPLSAFLDWMYGGYLHSDAEKAERIEQLDQFRLYEWQFHWVAERLSVLFGGFASLVSAALDAQDRPAWLPSSRRKP